MPGREMQERLGLSNRVETHLFLPIFCTSRNKQFPQVDLFPQSVYITDSCLVALSAMSTRCHHALSSFAVLIRLTSSVSRCIEAKPRNTQGGTDDFSDR